VLVLLLLQKEGWFQLLREVLLLPSCQQLLLLLLWLMRQLLRLLAHSGAGPPEIL
jgi:hypothetical protein